MIAIKFDSINFPFLIWMIDQGLGVGCPYSEVIYLAIYNYLKAGRVRPSDASWYQSCSAICNKDEIRVEENKAQRRTVRSQYLP